MKLFHKQSRYLIARPRMWVCASSTYPRRVCTNFTTSTARSRSLTSLFRKKCKIMYTDTNSFIYLPYIVECDDVYDIMKRYK